MQVQLKKGVMEMLVLALLTKEDRYGYDIAATISEYIEISEGTIYPLLNRLKKEAYVETYLRESANGPSRKYYSITQQGEQAFQTMKREWLVFSEEVTLLLERMTEDE